MGSHIPYLCITIILFVHLNYNKINKTQEVGSVTLIFYNNKKWMHSCFNNTSTWFTELFPFLFATKSFQQEDKTHMRSSQGIVNKLNSVNKIKQVVGYNHYLY